ncbi:hypothetical protein EAF00_005933 [Botryotinia globosa]|nr:hypothetical protein EAF00_005933 [Botryotinia globosa]
MPYIPSPRNLKPKHRVSRPEVRYRNDHVVVINQAGSRAYQQKEESSHPKIIINGGKIMVSYPPGHRHRMYH